MLSPLSAELWPSTHLNSFPTTKLRKNSLNILEKRNKLWPSDWLLQLFQVSAYQWFLFHSIISKLNSWEWKRTKTVSSHIQDSLIVSPNQSKMKVLVDYGLVFQHITWESPHTLWSLFFCKTSSTICSPQESIDSNFLLEQIDCLKKIIL